MLATSDGSKAWDALADVTRRKGSLPFEVHVWAADEAKGTACTRAGRDGLEDMVARLPAAKVTAEPPCRHLSSPGPGPSHLVPAARHSSASSLSNRQLDPARLLPACMKPDRWAVVCVGACVCGSRTLDPQHSAGGVHAGARGVDSTRCCDGPAPLNRSTTYDMYACTAGTRGMRCCALVCSRRLTIIVRAA